MMALQNIPDRQEWPGDDFTVSEKFAAVVYIAFMSLLEW